MKLEDQLSSLAPSKRLKELGVKQESLFYWTVRTGYPNGLLIFSRSLSEGEAAYQGKVSCSAFTVAELGEMLPVGFNSGSNNSDDWFCAVYNQPLAYSTTEAAARAKMLVYLLEKGLVKP